MLIGLGGYNPLEIRRKLRLASGRAEKQRLRVSKSTEEKATRARPEGARGFVWDAYKFLFDLEAESKQFGEFIDRLQDYCGKALNLTLADTERTSIHRLYVGTIRNIDYASKHVKVNEQTVFSGIFDSESMVLALDETGDKKLSLFIPSFTAEDLRLPVTKVDSIVNARKAEKHLASLKKKYKEFHEMIKSKISFVDLTAKSLGMERPNFSEEVSDDQDSGFDEEIDSSQLESRSPEYIVLKKRMDRVAAAKGRSHTLLVNLKI